MQNKKHIRFDWAIKRVLKQRANFGILEGFLSELLKEDIKIMEILESESNQETAEDKFNRVDILVKDTKRELIIIEVQNTYALDYFLRILYGISKAITEHIGLGDSYSKVKRVISVNIVYFELGHGNDYVYRGNTNFVGIHTNEILNLTAAQKKFFKKEKVEEIYPEIHLIKVNKFDDVAKDSLDEWIYFLKNSEIKKEFSAKGIKKANEVLQVANMSKEERLDYQRFVEVLSDRASIAETIEFESNLKAEKKVKQAVKQAVKETEQKVKETEQKVKETEQKVKETEQKVKETEQRVKETEQKVKETEQRAINEKKGIVKNLLQLGNLSDEKIAEIAQVSLDFIKSLKEK